MLYLVLVAVSKLVWQEFNTVPGLERRIDALEAHHGSSPSRLSMDSADSSE